MRLKGRTRSDQKGVWGVKRGEEKGDMRRHNRRKEDKV